MKKILFAILVLIATGISQERHRNSYVAPSERKAIRVSSYCAPLNGAQYWTGTIGDSITAFNVCLMGNSITASTDYEYGLMVRLGQHSRVTNKGVSGQMVYQMLERFNTDVIAPGNAEYVVILGGINDIAGEIPAWATKRDMQAMYSAAHNAGIKVVAVTVLPYKGSTRWSAQHQSNTDSVNVWIMTEAADVDYRVDANSALKDPANPLGLLPAYSTSDSLHLSRDGYYKLAETVYNGVNWVDGYKVLNGTLDLNGPEQIVDGGFEVGISGWGTYAGTLSRSTSVKYSGSASMLLVSNTTGGQNLFIAPNVLNTTANNFTLQCFAKVNRAQTLFLHCMNEVGGVSFGNQWVSVPANSFTRCVFNVTVPGTQSALKFVLNSGALQVGDSIWIDGASLTQSYDEFSGGIFNTLATGIMDILNSSKSASSTFRFYLNNTTPTVSVSDGTNTVTATNSATVNDGKNHFWSAYLNRTGNLTLSIDGVAGTGVSATGLGKIAVDTVRIGRGVFTNYLTGTVGQTVFAKSATTADYTSWTTQSIANMKAGKPLTAPSGTVFNVDWNAKKEGLTASGTPLPTTRKR